jgi:GGDEF domain-containing protein
MVLDGDMTSDDRINIAFTPQISWTHTLQYERTRAVMAHPPGQPWRFLRSLPWLRAPDPMLIDFGSGGPAFLLRVRAGIFAVLLLLSLGLQGFESDPHIWVTTLAAGVGLASCAFLSWRSAQPRRPTRLPFVAAAIDPGLVTLILVLFALQGRVNVAANSMFFWELYLLAIFLSALQFDPRVCVFSGALAFATFGAALLASRAGRLIRLSGTDSLTGLANRALFDQRLVVEVKTARRMERSLCVIFLDIDHFKHFNDRWGHRAGDDALRATADVLVEACRDSDVIARWGGEEFVIVLPAGCRGASAPRSPGTGSGSDDSNTRCAREGAVQSRRVGVPAPRVIKGRSLGSRTRAGWRAQLGLRPAGRRRAWS